MVYNQEEEGLWSVSHYFNWCVCLLHVVKSIQYSLQVVVKKNKKNKSCWGQLVRLDFTKSTTIVRIMCRVPSLKETGGVGLSLTGLTLNLTGRWTFVQSPPEPFDCWLWNTNHFHLSVTAWLQSPPPSVRKHSAQGGFFFSFLFFKKVLVLKRNGSKRKAHHWSEINRRWFLRTYSSKDQYCCKCSRREKKRGTKKKNRSDKSAFWVITWGPVAGRRLQIIWFLQSGCSLFITAFLPSRWNSDEYCLNGTKSDELSTA